MTVSVAVMQQVRPSTKRPSMSPISNLSSTSLLPPPSVLKRRRPFRRLVVALLFCAIICFVFLLLPYILPNLLRITTTVTVALSNFIIPSSSLISISQFRRLSRRTLRLYQRQLHLHPLSSRAITAAVIFFIADTAAQLLNRPKQRPLLASFSIPRLCRYTSYGLIIMGPFLYIWYTAMNEYGPPDDLRGSLIKCLFDQLTLEPLCISLYILFDGILCQRGMKEINKTLSSKFLSLWFKNAVFWMPENFANYYIGTPDLRVVFANLCSLFWNIYFSSKVNRTAVIGNHERKHESIQDIEEVRSNSNSTSQDIRRTTKSVSQANAIKGARPDIAIK